MTPEQWLAVIVDHSTRMAATPAAALGESVPSCEGWTVYDLIAHVGGVHRWAVDMVSGVEPQSGYEDIVAPPGADVLDWYAAGADLLVETLSDRDPDSVARTFIGEATVAFWFRRQAHELVVHLWDRDSAVAPDHNRGIDGSLATDGVDEWLDVFAPRFLARSGGVPEELRGRSVHLHSSDVADGEWLVELTETGVVHRREHGKADVALRGTASDLLLGVWRRRALDELDPVGDLTVAESLLGLVRVT